jgi:hypothetical protein
LRLQVGPRWSLTRVSSCKSLARICQVN